MDCELGLLSSKIDAPKHPTKLEKTKIANLLFNPQEIVISDTEEDKMGVENTWTSDDDEFVSRPIPPELPNTLPPPIAAAVDATPTFGDSVPSSTPILGDLECYFTPVKQIVLVNTQEYNIENELSRDGGYEPGVCGLINLGNTCFMNSGLQCLVATAPISVELAKVSKSPSRSLTTSLSDLMRKVWSGRYPVINPSHFKMALANQFPQFNDFRQHDCQEFLALLLDGLHEQLNTAGRKGAACQVDSDDLRSPKNLNPKPLDHGDQSTSKEDDTRGEEDTISIRKLVDEVSEKQKKNNLDKSTQLGDFSGEGSPDSFDSDTPGTSEKSCDLSQKQLNNQLLMVPGSAPKEEVPVIMNNQVLNLNSFDDILKEDKTSNLNVLVNKEDTNNTIRLNSEKYPRHYNTRQTFRNNTAQNKADRFRINALQIDNNTCGKRNSTLSNMSFSLDIKEGLDLKRVKLHSDEDKNQRMELERRQNSPELLLEKNERIVCERKETKGSLLRNGIACSLLSPNLADITIDKTSEVEADKHWHKHLAENKSVIVNTFQGQFKSTVVCSVCKHISVTYEPFMYLSVPLPNAMQRKLKVTFIGESLKHPTEFLLELNKYDTVSYLRDQILLKVGCEVKGPIMIAEVLNHHVAKFLEEHQLIRNLNDTERSLYAFEVKTLLDKSTIEPIDDLKVQDYPQSSSCIICLEDQANMKQHEECSCILCDTCIAASCDHYNSTTFNCPVCRKEINSDVQLKPLKSQPYTTPRMINIPLVFRVDTVGDGNNNQNHVELFGHPMVVRIPSRCSAESLHKELASVLYYKESFRLLLVDGQGLRCSRCMFQDHCRGCELPSDVTFSSSDSIAVVFAVQVPVLPTTLSLALLSAQASSLTLYDCIQAFSQSEVLDGNNPWFCPQCKLNRSATKTLSVWRYPDYLIVYLKRFVFHNHISTKLEEKVLFPLTGLSLASGSDYDLYACVCHIGGVSAGHYTTYAQHPYTGQWHYFNDGGVSNNSPVEDDYSNAYVLFYKKQGLQPPAMTDLSSTTMLLE